MQRLSSGLRVNSAADDAAGLGISERMRAQIRGLEQANRSLQDGISLLRTMEGALETVHSILHRARELAVQYNNGTLSWGAKDAISAELTMLSHEVARIEDTTHFNGIALLQDATATITLQVGANQGEVILVSLTDLFGPGLSLVRPATFFVIPWIDADIVGFDAHISDVATARGRIGGQMNRLQHALAANQGAQGALMAAESRIRDVDVALEMVSLTRAKLLQQSGLAVLQTTHDQHARVLQLLDPSP